MKTEQRVWTATKGWAPPQPNGIASDAQLVLVFGSRAVLDDPSHLREIQAAYPKAKLLGCSTSGEICGTRVLDDSLVTTAVHFQHTKVVAKEIHLSKPEESRQAGRDLAKLLDKQGLRHALVMSDGLNVNGSELVKGLVEEIPAGVAVTGGLSGDGAKFEKTLVVSGNSATPGKVAVLGFYGEKLKIGYGSMGGWDSFGPDRRVTRSKGNVLYELDGQSALDLYKRYLGEHAAGLPASGLLFPLSLRTNPSDTGVVRTILAVNEKDQSMTFAGDIPEGAFARLMKANFERLIDGANGAAKTSYEAIGSSRADLAILISCVGRKLVLKQRIEEEVESVRDILGPSTALAGFYSYGEISPFTQSARCELHNQTMTITTFSED